MRLQIKLGIGAMAALLSTPGLCQAGTATGTFTVTATIVSACTVTANNLSFGTYSPTATTALTNSSTINVFCTSGTPFTIALNVGSATGSTFTARHMANGSSLLNYNLYTSSALSTVWGDATGGTATVAGTGAGLLTSSPSTVYGSMPINQDLPPGSYTSTITVTVSY